MDWFRCVSPVFEGVSGTLVPENEQQRSAAAQSQALDSGVLRVYGADRLCSERLLVSDACAGSSFVWDGCSGADAGADAGTYSGTAGTGRCSGDRKSVV